MGRVTLQTGQDGRSRDVYTPLDTTLGQGRRQGVINPDIKVQPPSPGVVIYRFEESFVYPNSSYVTTALTEHIRKTTRRGGYSGPVSPADRPWNDPGPGPNDVEDDNESRKVVIKAVVLDMSAVGHLDTTSVQNLIDTR